MVRVLPPVGAEPVAAQSVARLNTDSWDQAPEFASTLTIRATEYDGGLTSSDWYSFDISAISDGATITSAVFTLYPATGGAK
jgi:hypothetical protein